MYVALSLSTMQGRFLALLFVLAFFSAPALAQVSVKASQDEVIISNEGFQAQRVVRAAGKASGSGWMVMDAAGNAYPVGGYLAGSSTGGKDDPDDPIVVVVDGYQGGSSTGGKDDPDDPIVVVVDGYQSVLRHLQETYGVIVEHDETLGVDLLILPRVDDPFAAIVNVLTNDTVNGRPITDYFRFIELATLGAFDLPLYEAVKPAGAPLPFPNDLYYKNQWNLQRSRMAQAQWHPAVAQHAVRVSIIDSGIGAAQRAHEGLDGVELYHESVAPTTGYPLAHGLGITSLLADRSQDGSGGVGLLGAWEGNGCYTSTPLLADATPQIYSYNVGDFSPSSVYVARAIQQSISQGVDVINLSLRLAYSPSVEEAIRAALAQNIIVVAAAGNYTEGTAQRPATFPANLEGVISVGAADSKMTMSPFSAKEGVDILAPGEDVLVGGPDGLWYYAEGTSFAAPHVTAAVAMMRAVRPDLTTDEALEALQRRAWAKERTGGIGFLNVLSSLNHVLPARQRVRYVADPHRCSGSSGEDVAGKGGAWDTVEDYDDSIDDDLFAASAAADELPAAVALHGNYPNPFNPETTIRFELPAAQNVRLAVFNVLGQEVQVLAAGRFEAGAHDVHFRASGLPSGLYLARLETPTRTLVQTMTLAK